ncbi:MAG: hypothetical protein LBU45_08355 [Azoarcus sp.]|jgi:hypothetical protein|nr:hypothetical protein [Azoarcus sp.]
MLISRHWRKHPESAFNHFFRHKGGGEASEEGIQNETALTHYAIIAANSLILQAWAGFKREEGLSTEQIFDFFVENGLPADASKAFVKEKESPAENGSSPCRIVSKAGVILFSF